MQQAVDNSNLKNMGFEGSPMDVFNPAIKLEFGNFATEPPTAPFFGLKVTDQTDYVNGDGPKIIHVKVYNETTGAELQETLTVTGEPGEKVLNISSFSGGMRVTALIITNNHFRADGSYKFDKFENTLQSVGRSVMLAHWVKKGGKEF